MGGLPLVIYDTHWVCLGLRLIWINGALSMTQLGVQGANVTEEEARQVLY